VREDVAGVIDYIFGYGSLAGGELTALGFVPSRVRRPEGFVADLAGMRRGWGVAMDNRLDRPGYKHYVDGEGDGRRYSSASSMSGRRLACG
jgi:hypothetical protein